MLTDLPGQIERITYTNDENGYTIAKVKVYGRLDLVTAVGNVMAPMPGEILKMQGELVRFPCTSANNLLILLSKVIPRVSITVAPDWHQVAPKSFHRV
jgi:exodeoxyribonuclease V alpha subunit